MFMADDEVFEVRGINGFPKRSVEEMLSISAQNLAAFCQSIGILEGFCLGLDIILVNRSSPCLLWQTFAQSITMGTAP